MFPGGMGNMQAMMKKVQKMQSDMVKMQEEMKSRTVETSVGGGALSITFCRWRSRHRFWQTALIRMITAKRSRTRCCVSPDGLYVWRQ